MIKLISMGSYGWKMMKGLVMSSNITSPSIYVPLDGSLGPKPPAYPLASMPIIRVLPANLACNSMPDRSDKANA